MCGTSMHLAGQHRVGVKQGRTGPRVLSFKHALGLTRYELIETIVLTIWLSWTWTLIGIENRLIYMIIFGTNRTQLVGSRVGVLTRTILFLFASERIPSVSLSCRETERTPRAIDIHTCVALNSHERGTQGSWSSGSWKCSKNPPEESLCIIL